MRSPSLRSLWLFIVLFMTLTASPHVWVQGFSFASPRGERIGQGFAAAANNKNNLLVKTAPARIPQDLNAIRECRSSSREVRRVLRDADRNFLNASALLAASQGDGSNNFQCVLMRERFYPFRVLGTADVRWNPKSGTAFVYNVFVREEERGKGLAKKLMAGVEDLVQSDEYFSSSQESSPKKVALYVQTKNSVAMNLYRRCGYNAPGVDSVMSTIGELSGLNLMVSMTKNV